MQRHEQLTGLQGIASGSGAEILDWQRAFPGRAGDAAGRAESDEKRNGIGAGGGVAEIAADGGASALILIELLGPGGQKHRAN